MGSSQTLNQATPSWDLDGISTHPARQQRTAHAQPPSRDLEQAFDRLNPDYGIPADTHNPHSHQALRDREAALALGTASLSPAAARTTPTQSSGWPARTNEPPTPPAPPISNWAGAAVVHNGSAPNANPPPRNTPTKEP